MLDNTLVVWGSEMSDAVAHSYSNLPYIMAGSAGGTFKTGQVPYLDPSLTGHRLLCTILQGFGVTGVNSLSDQDPGSGVISSLLA